MKTNCRFKYISIVLASILLSSCTKFLNKKPSDNLVIPSMVDDLQALLDDNTSINHRNPIADERSADDYYLLYEDYNALTPESMKRMYTWQKDNLFERNDPTTEWAYLYHAVYRSNIVLEQIDEVDIDQYIEAKRNLEGHARFIRAKNFLHGALIWSLAYDESTADTDLGIPLKLSSDYNKTSVRSTLQETYQQIISDLKLSIQLLPTHAAHKLRPGKVAAYGLLARVYLAMRDYKNCLSYTDSALSITDTLIDFNSLNVNATWPFSPRFSNPEDLLNMYSTSPVTLNNSIARIDRALYQSYEKDDLRKKVYFKKNSDNTYSFKGSIIGSGAIYTGIATDELYLMKAECLARENNVNEAMHTLNTLLSSRWLEESFVPYTANGKQQALTQILTERRKELLMRGLRWMDIKRLNKEGANISLTRNLNETIYTLPANDLRFALPIPEDIVEATGMQQNPR